MWTSACVCFASRSLVRGAAGDNFLLEKTVSVVTLKSKMYSDRCLAKKNFQFYLECRTIRKSVLTI